MAHPYPAHHDNLPYTGKHHYFLTFCTNRQEPFFVEPAKVELVRAQFLRTESQVKFALTAYCFMPDHLHLIASGLAEDADVKKFIARAKQYSGFHFKREFGISLWQRYGFERVIRDDMELACTIGYIVANPVRAGLVSHPSLYPHLGSTRFEVADLLEICDYDRRLTQPSA
jgi:putative transposase